MPIRPKFPGVDEIFLYIKNKSILSSIFWGENYLQSSHHQWWRCTSSWKRGSRSSDKRSPWRRYSLPWVPGSDSRRSGCRARSRTPPAPESSSSDLRPVRLSDGMAGKMASTSPRNPGSWWWESLCPDRPSTPVSLESPVVPWSQGSCGPKMRRRAVALVGNGGGGGTGSGEIYSGGRGRGVTLFCNEKRIWDFGDVALPDRATLEPPRTTTVTTYHFNELQLGRLRERKPKNFRIDLIKICNQSIQTPCIVIFFFIKNFKIFYITYFVK